MLHAFASLGRIIAGELARKKIGSHQSRMITALFGEGLSVVQNQDLQCQEYYQTRFTGYLNQFAPGMALDECLHDFLDQRPQGKYTARNRAAGLVAASFWFEPVNLEGAQVASQALARALHFDDVGNLSPDILFPMGRPDIGRFGHRRGWRDRIDRADFTDGVRDTRDRLVDFESVFVGH